MAFQQRTCLSKNLKSFGGSHPQKLNTSALIDSSHRSRAGPDRGKLEPVKQETSAKSVERLFPFVLRSRLLLVGRDRLRHSKSVLHFVLMTEDVSENTRAEILSDFAHYPVLQHYTSGDLERFFQIRGAKVVGFKKSGLAQSIYAELKEFRINRPPAATKKD